ncbi:hypothetical protein BY996DRAFT_6824966, partial [Phakopsora pachyrhizi]
ILYHCFYDYFFALPLQIYFFCSFPLVHQFFPNHQNVLLTVSCNLAFLLPSLSYNFSLHFPFQIPTLRCQNGCTIFLSPCNPGHNSSPILYDRTC